MIRGDDNSRDADLDKLVAWLRAEGKPDVVHLSNALLLGLAPRLRNELGAAVVCTLQDEDAWIDAMSAAGREQAWEAVSQKARDCDAFLPVSHYYSEFMRERAALPEDKLQVVHLGIDLEPYAARDALPEPPVVGYLSRMARGMGLGALADAYVELKKEFPDLKLAATGGMTSVDKAFFAGLRRRLARQGVLEDVAFLQDFSTEKRVEFLRSLSVMSVPATDGEAFGMFQIEALACGVPVVQPDVGAFPEIVDITGGGVIYDSKDPSALCATLSRILRARDELVAMGNRGREAVLERFGIDTMASNMFRVYEMVTGK
jgi:glycosyltransferase involved in cell wall biosynthesis